MKRKRWGQKLQIVAFAPDFSLFTAHGSGGGKRIRTADPLRAKQVLSQLSYTPQKNNYELRIKELRISFS